MYARAGFGDIAPSLNFQKTSGASLYPNFLVGDSWQATITGPANSIVWLQSSRSGSPIPSRLACRLAARQIPIPTAIRTIRIRYIMEHEVVGRVARRRMVKIINHDSLAFERRLRGNRIGSIR